MFIIIIIIIIKPVNANPGLTFSSIQMFFAALFCLFGDR